MSFASHRDFLEALAKYRLLDAGQLSECQRLQGQFADPRLLARELVKKGWLTAYQVNALFQGKGAELQLGSYVMLDRLGEGGMGSVYRARHAKMGRVVALKVIRPDRLTNANAVRRFQQEVRAASALSHPNVVIAYDADEVAGTHFFAMEFVEGQDLAQMVKKRGPLPVAEACEYIRQAALGLQHAHERGLIHRDIKPANLLVTADGGTVKLLDLGLARLRQSGDAGVTSSLTQDGSVMGTPDYVAPEQAMNSRAVDIRADLYSLGCTLYYLLTAQVPFPGETIAEKLLKHQLHEPKPVEQLRPDVPATVAEIVRKLMAKKPEQRFQTPAEVAKALADALHGRKLSNLKRFLPTGTRKRKTGAAADDRTQPMTAPARLQVLYRKHRGLVLAAGGGLGLLGLLVCMGAVWTVMGFFRTGDRTPTTPTGGGPLPRVTNSLGMILVQIPAGSFKMGSPESEVGRGVGEGPVHDVRISRPFWLGTHEVTNGQFRAFVQATGYQTDAERAKPAGCLRFVVGTGQQVFDPKCNWQNPGWTASDDLPVVCVSWRDANEFCKWLSTKEGRTYRLPTEAEWEYACRAGTSSVFGFGNTLSSAEANFNGEQPYGHPTRGLFLGSVNKVGSYKPNAWGLYDMHGNVWEWCSDFFDPIYYLNSPSTDPHGPERGQSHVARGGAWNEPGAICRSAMRGNGQPDYRTNFAGFRVARTP